MTPRQTIAARLEATKGRTSGWDYMRLILAVLVVCWHSALTSYGAAGQTEFGSGPARPVIAVILPMFFTLSGFLVAGSLQRSRSVIGFLGLRGIRIFPALAVESLIAALIVGPLLTTLPLADYFADGRFWRYFRNMLGHPVYWLPGVFETNPIDKVNGQLWTVPYELECYIALAVLGVLGATRRPALILLAAAAFTAWNLWIDISAGAAYLDEAAGPVPGWSLVVSFLLGVAVYLYQDRLPWSRALCGLAAVAALGFLAVPYGEVPAVVLLAYVTVYLGLCDPPKVGLLKGADYSYGIFLYGFIIQQALMSLGPQMHHWWINIALAVPGATIVAALSWHCIEKPALGLRTVVYRIEMRMLDLGGAALRSAGFATKQP